MKKYKLIRVPEEVWKDWFDRKMRIQERIKIATNKPQKISLTSVLRFYGKRKAYIWDDEVLSFFKNANKRKKFMGELL